MDTPSPRYLSYDEIMAATDDKVVDVTVPAWGGTLQVGTFTKAQQDSYLAAASIGDGQGGTKIDNGLLQKQLFQVAVRQPALSPEQVAAIWTKKADAVDAVLKAILDLNGMSRAVQQAAEAAFPAQPEPVPGV